MSKKEKQERSEPPVIDENVARDLVSSVFFGFLPESSKNGTEGAAATGAVKNDKGRRETRVKTKTEDESTAKIMSALQLDNHIPTDPSELKEKPIFKSTYKLLQWQRDNYLVGQDYANWRKAERQQPHEQGSVNEIAMDPTALGHGHIAGLASDFIPSNTVRQAALPLVAGLPSGALYPITRNATIDLIQGQQQNLDNFLKKTILTYLQNPDNRMAIKNSTQGFIATKYRDDSSGEKKQSES